jgi:hypothetical protein
MSIDLTPDFEHQQARPALSAVKTSNRNAGWAAQDDAEP